MLKHFFVGLFAVCLSTGGWASELNQDSFDPLFMPEMERVLSQSRVLYGRDVLRFGQNLSYGMNNRLVFSADVNYQNDFAGDEDGFSSVDLGGVYRVATASDSNAQIISDVIFGFKFGGSSHVRTPYFADSTYYAGWRFGRQWAGLTLSGTIKSSWVFDSERGMSFIDFIPEAYFRVAPDWRLGAGATIRKATNPNYDQEWLNFKVVRQYGRTQYAGIVNYEFEDDTVQIGLGINILF